MSSRLDLLSQTNKEVKIATNSVTKTLDTTRITLLNELQKKKKTLLTERFRSRLLVSRCLFIQLLPLSIGYQSYAHGSPYAVY